MTRTQDIRLESQRGNQGMADIQVLGTVGQFISSGWCSAVVSFQFPKYFDPIGSERLFDALFGGSD